ncbi:MAG: PAS domain S-box protein [Bacteroidota bacterium]|nr:PAS domain S-box protein [Bacteroidota bacterium]
MSVLHAQKTDSTFTEIEKLINTNSSLAVTKLNNIKNRAIEKNDTSEILRCYDYYITIFEKNSSNTNEKNFLVKKIKLLKEYSHNHVQNFSILNDLFNTYQKLAEYYFRIDEPNTSIDIYFRMIYISQNLKNKTLEISVYNSIAQAFQLANNYNKSIEYFNVAIMKARELGDSTIVYYNCLDKGSLNYSFGYFSKAVSNYYSALLIAEALDNTIFENQIYNKMSELFYELAYYDKSLEYLDKAIALNYKDSKDELSSDQKAQNYLFCGENLLQTEKYNEALNCFVKAEKYLQNSKDYLLISQKNASMGITLIELKQYDKAKLYLSKAISLQQKIGDSTGLNKSNFAYGKYHFYTKNYTKAKYFFIKSYNFSEKHSDFLMIKENSNLLYKIFKEENNYQKALEFYEKYSYALSNVYRQKFSISIKRIDVEHKYKKETALANQKVELLNRQKRKLFGFIAILSVAFLAIIVFAVFFFRKNRIVNRQKIFIEKQKSIILKQYEKSKMLSLVAEHTSNSIFIMDTKGKVLWINDALLKLYKTTQKVIFEKNNADYTKLTKYDFEKVFQVCNIKRKPITYVTEVPITDEKVWVQTTISPIIENGIVVKLIGIESEITDFKEAEIKIQKQKKDIEFKNKLLEVYNLELKDQKEAIIAQNEELQQQQEELHSHMEVLEEYNNKLHRLSVIASETDNIIYIFDIYGEIAWVNRAFEKYTGYNLQEFKEEVGENIITASTVKDIDFYFYTCIEQKKSVNYISEFITKCGKRKWLQTTLSPIKDEDGKVIEVVAVDSDITGIKQAEQKIFQQHKEIKSSLEYAGLLQRSVMPLPIFINAIFDNNFVFNRPRDIVSGDFFFVYYDNDISIFAVADCTGHGIPGAFMSLIGTMALRVVVSRTKSYNPNILLNMLNGEIIKLLHQRGKKNESMDSIDMALCSFDFKNDTLDYSGANIPLYIARETDNRYSINRIKPTKATIGYNTLKEPFTVHSFKIKKGDRLYMSSDGISDQFGGVNDKKLKRKGFVGMLEHINSMPFEEQLETFEIFIDHWMGAADQVDDMLFVGIEY